MIQEVARRSGSAYLPLAGVLPSATRASPARAVIATGYESPVVLQWPSLCCCFASQASPFSTVGRYFSGTSSARAAAVRANTPRNRKMRIGLSVSRFAVDAGQGGGSGAADVDVAVAGQFGQRSGGTLRLR